MKNDKTTHVTENFDREVSQQEATEEFIKQLEGILQSLRQGDRVLRHGLIAVATELLPEDLDTDMDPETKANFLANLDKTGNETVVGAGPPGQIMELVSRLPEMVCDNLIAEHQAECDNEDNCVIHDPTVAPYLGTLKAMAMTLARTSSQGNTKATEFLHKSLKQMGREAVKLSRIKEMVESFHPSKSDTRETGMFAIEGDKAKKVLQMLAEAGALPPELAEKFGKSMEETEDGTTPPDEMSKDCTFVRNGTTTKH